MSDTRSSIQRQASVSSEITDSENQQIVSTDVTEVEALLQDLTIPATDEARFRPLEREDDSEDRSRALLSATRVIQANVSTRIGGPPSPGRNSPLEERETTPPLDEDDVEVDELVSESVTMVSSQFLQEDSAGHGHRNSRGVMHWVKMTDTLPGLALKYGTTTEAIRLANKLYGDSIYERGYILIPVQNYTGPLHSQRDEEEDRKTLVKRFQVLTKCVDVDESWSYMRRAEFDVNAAVDEYMGDVKWEETHPFQGIPRHPLSRSYSTSSAPTINRKPKNNWLTRSSTYSMLTFSRTKKNPPSSTVAPAPVTLKDSDATSISSESTVKSWKRLLRRS